MKRERSKGLSAVISGIDAGIDVPISQVQLPEQSDLVAMLFEKENLSVQQIKDSTAHGGKSYLDIQHILALNTYMVDEDRKAYLEASGKLSMPSQTHSSEELHKETLPLMESIKNGKSPFVSLLDKFFNLVASFFGLESDKPHPSNWPKLH